MKKRNILLVLLMTVSFVVHAHGDKQKDKGMLKGLDTPAAKVVLAFHEALDLVESAYLEGRFSYLEWVTTRQEFLTTRLTLIEAASQVHLSKTEIETLTGLALKTEHNAD